MCYSPYYWKPQKRTPDFGKPPILGVLLFRSPKPWFGGSGYCLGVSGLGVLGLGVSGLGVSGLGVSGLGV